MRARMRARIRPRWAAAILVATAFAGALAAGPAGAQLRGVPPRPVTRADSARADSAAVATAAAVMVPTEPNAVRVVVIPVPVEVSGRSGTFSFLRQSGLAVIGRLNGAFDVTGSQRAILLTVTVPATAPAGRTTVGVMRFTCDTGCDAIDVPVILDVQTRTSLHVEPTRTLAGTRPGGRVRTEAMVRNTGNAAEQITLVVQTPNDWRSRVLVPLPIRIAAGASALIPVEISISNDAGTGDYGVNFVATTAGGVLATVSISIRVSSGQGGALGWRPLLEANAAMARDGSGELAGAYGLELSGELLPHVRANGRANLVPGVTDLPPLTQRSFGRLGYSANSSYLMLTAPNWDGGVGMVGNSDAGLAGTGLWGIGGTAHAKSDQWQGSAFGVEPNRGGHYLLGDVSRRVGRLWTGVVFGDLRDRLSSVRSARTVAGSVELPWRGGDFLVQAGQRSSERETGLGWLTHISHRAEDWSFSARAMHAPGGASAFAHAEDELQLDGFRRFSKAFSVGANTWTSHDGGSAGQLDFGSSGWSLNQQIGLGRAGALGIETHGSSSRGKSAVGGFGNSEREIQATWTGEVAGVQTRLAAARGMLERTSTITDAFDLDTRAPRTSLLGAVSMSTRHGAWQVEVTTDRTGAGVGIPTRQTSVAARVDQVPLVPGRVFLRAEALTYYLGATSSTATSQVLGIDVRISDVYQLTFDAERNDFQRGTAGHAPWVVSTKIRRAIGIPAVRSGALRGIVFRDLNANGVRDRDEGGMMGAVIHVDGDVTASDAQGRFALGRSRPSTVDLDPRSLPAGWMAGPQKMGANASIELAVIPTAPVEITLRLTGTQGLDTANVHFERAVIFVRDSLGRQWNGAPNARGFMRFDALPPGVYQVSADLARVGETLVLPAELPVAVVEGGGAPLKIELLVSPRTIRLNLPSGRGKQGGADDGQREPR